MPFFFWVFVLSSFSCLPLVRYIPIKVEGWVLMMFYVIAFIVVSLPDKVDDWRNSGLLLKH